MKKRVLAFLVVFGALLCIVAPLAAQDDAGTYFRVALWDVKRTHWSSYEENFTKNQKPILDKLLAEDGLLIFCEILPKDPVVRQKAIRSRFYASPVIGAECDVICLWPNAVCKSLISRVDEC